MKARAGFMAAEGAAPRHASDSPDHAKLRLEHGRNVVDPRIAAEFVHRKSHLAYDAILDLVPRIIWFESPQQAIAEPIRFLAYAMTYAPHEDVREIHRYVSDDDLREALDNAPPGIMDPRSWAYWNSILGRYPLPPITERSFGEAIGTEELARKARMNWIDRDGGKSMPEVSSGFELLLRI